MKGFTSVFLSFALLTLEYVILSLAQECSSNVQSLNAESSSTKILTSPNYPLKYSSKASSCQWRITAPRGYLIQIKFTSFNTPGGLSQSKTCVGSYDSLEIYDSYSLSYSNLRGKYCGKTLPTDVISSARYLYLQFNAYSNNPGTGFRFEYKAVKNPAEDLFTCSPFNSASTNNDIKLKASSSSKYIKSPYYPNKYPSGIQCTWIISASSSSKIIQLTLTDVQIMNTNYDISCLENSLRDSLTIRDGSIKYSPELETFCGKKTSSTTVTSKGQKMWIQFITNTDNYFTGSTSGFKASYIEVDKPDNTVGMVVGIIIGIIAVIGFIACCMCIAKRRGHAGYVRGNTSGTTVQTTTTTTTHPAPAPQYPMQMQGGPPPGGSYPPPPSGGGYPPPPSGGSYPPPPPGGSYPPPTSGGSYPPPPPGGSYPQQPQGSYPPPTTGGYPPYPSEKGPDVPPPQYPGPPGYPAQSGQPYNPQSQGGQPNPPYPPPQGSEYQAAAAATYPPSQDTKASAPPQC